ncbi:MAG: methyltransferase, partial [Clostridia bacterium]|nr:methyltransferase [Clostridia bacterium]
FLRVLKPGGILIRAVPCEDHLWGLKKAVYDRPYLNAPPAYSPDGFTLLERNEVRRTAVIDNAEDILSLFMMTPYYYKTGRDDQQKLNSLSRLETEFSFSIFVLKK